MTFESNSSHVHNVSTGHEVYAPVHERLRVSPGRLYMLITADYAKRRGHDCSFCRVPLLGHRERPHEGACNWRVEEAPRNCPSCEAIVQELIARYQQLYDVIDPWNPG